MNLENWRQATKRVARMERAELQSRVSQEFNKRQDSLLSLLRFDFGHQVRRSDRSTRGKFFFAPEELNGRLDLLRQRMPGQVDQIVQQAEKILQHRFDLLGHTNLDYGNLIDWHLDLVHGKRAPRKLFHRVRYLDFGEVGDSKVTWELNRHQHFVTLAKAYRLTGDPRYPDEILRQWRNWWAENPYPVGINWASSLEAGFRSLSWLWTCHLLEDTPGPEFRDEWLKGLALHGRHIERYLSTYFSPNTHLLGEGVALFFLGVLCPELDAAERWKATGWRIVLEEAQRQVLADGFHFEQSTYYHVYALDFFLHAAILASINDIHAPSEFEQALERMLTALCLLARAGSPARFGDDDGGRLFDPRRNRGEHLLDPLSTGAILFNRGDYKAAATQLREETIWLLGPQGVQSWDELNAKPAHMNSASLPASGYYLMPSDKPATQLVVDCGPLGIQSGGHGHADALSMTLHSRGHELLIDSGTYEYVGEDRNLFRGTGMHNTLKVDGVDQSEPKTAFSWHQLTRATADEWIQGKHFDLLVGSHDGYQRLAEPVTHWRWVFSLRNGLYLVRDRVEGRGTHHLEVSWHMREEMQLNEHGVFRWNGAPVGLAILASKGHGWAEEVRKRSWSPVYGQKAPSTVLTYFATLPVPRAFCVMLVTLEEALARPGTFVRIGDSQSDSAVEAYRFSGEDEEHNFFFGKCGKTWQFGAITSDAEFVCWSQWQKRGTQRLILVNGSNAEVEKGLGLHFKQTVSWGELSLEGDQREIFSSELDALEDDTVPSLKAGHD